MRFFYSILVPLGSISELPADSCREIKKSEGGQAVSGYYWLDLEKNGESLKVYCDMTTDNGKSSLRTGSHLRIHVRVAHPPSHKSNKRLLNPETRTTITFQHLQKVVLNRQFSFSLYRTGTSLQLRLMRVNLF